MNWLDITTYLGMHAKGALILFLIMVLLFSPPFIVAFAEEEEGEHKKWIKAFLIIYIALLSISIIPTHDKILQLKISKIKNEAVNKENITKGVETLERIGEKLECKYLGCGELNNED